MRFFHPEFLWLLVLLLPLALLYNKKGNVPALRFSTLSIAQNLGNFPNSRPGNWAFFLRLLSLVLLIVAMARPQYGNTTTEIEASGIDILLAVDISGSMEAMDFSLDGRQVNRLTVVKKVVQDFIKNRPNDRIGLLAFSGKPYLISPLTLDHHWILKRLEALQIGNIKEDGTAIGSAIAAGINRLRGQQAKSKIVILLTDGMNNTGQISPLIAAEAAETLHIKLYTIGAGTHGKAPFPVIDPFGRKRLVWESVDIDEQTLQQVAAMTGGRYFRATDTVSMENIYKEIDKMETTTRKITRFENYRELYPYVLFIFFLLFGAEIYRTKKRLP